MRQLLPLLVLCLPTAGFAAEAKDMEPVHVAKDKHSFIFADSGRRFVPWGFNYDHDAAGRLIEDYWDGEWAKVEKDFADMHKFGANVVRIHLQFGKFMDAADKPNDKQLDRLGDLLKLAERERLYLDLTGLACYHKKDIPAWYDKLDEKERWGAQAHFWQAVAERCAKSNAVFCYDLMNEAIPPGKKVAPGGWLVDAPLGDSYFVQFISLDPGDRTPLEVERQWIHRLTSAIHEKDKRHLITLGMLPFIPDRKVCDDLDFVSVHLYPQAKKVNESLDILKAFAAFGKPVLIEETFPLSCSMAEFEEFIDKSDKIAAGWIGFFWGETPDELKKSKTLAAAMTLGWLEFFQKKSKTMRRESEK
jgi:Cellulase (glycosyl hydrolase family 5)